jgi:hypothetical protein
MGSFNSRVLHRLGRGAVIGLAAWLCLDIANAAKVTPANMPVARATPAHESNCFRKDRERVRSLMDRVPSARPDTAAFASNRVCK